MTSIPQPSVHRPRAALRPLPRQGLATARRHRRATARRHDAAVPGAARQRGAVLILVAVTLVALLGFAGLALDGGRAYAVKARLSAAADAGAIAGARALSEGADDAARAANARAAAERYFDANFPPAYQASTLVGRPVTTVTRDPAGYWRVNVSARARMPTAFARVIGHPEMDITTLGETIRRDLDIMMVLDSSGSIGGAMPTLKAAAKTGFVERFSDGPAGDRLGIVAFSSGSEIRLPIRTPGRGHDRAAALAAIDSLAPTSWTATAEAMRKALDQLNAVPVANRSTLRIMLVFSDGAPNTFGARLVTPGGPQDINLANDGFYRSDALNDRRYGFPGGATLPDPLPMHALGGYPLSSYRGFANRDLGGAPYANSMCNRNKAARNLIENIANEARRQNVVVYAVGLGPILNQIEVPFGACGYDAKDHGAYLLRRIANAEGVDSYDASQPKGMFCHAVDAAELKACFESIAEDIIRLTL